MENNLPEQIYLQVYDAEGHLLNATRNEVTWCVDRINENDAAYILATPELAALLGRLANCTLLSEHGNAPDLRQCIKDRRVARTIATQIKEALDDSRA